MVVSRHVLALAVVGAVGLLANQARALTLADLTAPNATPIVVGDRIYNNFSFSSATLTASQITVTQITDGLRFTGNWNTDVSPVVDTVIQYDVSVTGSNTLTNVGLTWGTAHAAGGAVAAVGEQVRDLHSSAVYNLQVLNDGPGPLPDTNSASVTLNPATTGVHVIKDIEVSRAGHPTDGVLTSAAVTGAASIDFVDNTFVQSGSPGTPPEVVPEPAALALLPLALLGLGLRRRFRR